MAMSLHSNTEKPTALKAEADYKPLSSEEDTEDDELRSSDSCSPPQRRLGRLLLISVVVNIVLSIVCSFTVLSTFLWREQKTPSRQTAEIPEPYSPANAELQYEYREVMFNDTDFTGRPSPEWEQHMHNLMAGTLLRVSAEELAMTGAKSIPLKDGGYAAGLGVAHNLHCVKKIKQFLYREQYYSDLDPTGADWLYAQEHADHCLDWLRQGVLCHVDTSLITLYWGEHRQDIPTHKVPGPQKCVNWEKLQEWMSDRSVNSDMLVGP